MPTIRDLPSAWRQDLMPAHFDGKPFHVDTGSRESGRRIVVHEFPKKEQPYSEDMGRRAVSFSVRGYCIVYPHEEFSAPSLYRRDYRIARDNLQARLETGGPGVLQLPTLPPMRVVCQRYRLTEDDKTGGYCTFDMQFVEAGVQPFAPQIDTQANLTAQSNTLKGVIAQVWAAQRAATGREYGINNKMQLLHRFTGDSTTPVYLQALNNYVGKPAGPDLSKYTGPSTTPITQHSWSPM